MSLQIGGRLFQYENMVAIVLEHCSRKEDCVLRDIWDTELWKGQFGGDTNGVRLGLCTDGVSPFKGMHVVYSMWLKLAKTGGIKYPDLKSWKSGIIVGKT